MSFKELGGLAVFTIPMLLVCLAAAWYTQTIQISVRGYFPSYLLLPTLTLFMSVPLAAMMAVTDCLRRREAWLWKLGYLQSLGPVVVLSFNGPSSIETGPVPQGMRAMLETLGFQVDSLDRQQLDYARQNGGWLNRQDNYLGFECCLYEPRLGEPSARVYLEQYYGGSNRTCLAWFDVGYIRRPRTDKDGAALVRRLLLMANTVSAGLRL